jgi:hypothetical protein
LLFKKVSSILNKSINEFNHRDTEYKKMTERNKIKSEEIRHSIEQKSKKFRDKKKAKESMFDSIRNK